MIAGTLYLRFVRWEGARGVSQRGESSGNDELEQGLY